MLSEGNEDNCIKVADIKCNYYTHNNKINPIPNRWGFLFYGVFM